MGKECCKKPSEHSGTVAESWASSCHHLKQREKYRVSLKATSDVDISLYCGTGVFLWGPGQLTIGHIRTDTFHQCDRNNLGCLSIDGGWLILWLWSVDRTIETSRAATLDYDSQKGLDILQGEEKWWVKFACTYMNTSLIHIEFG